LRQEGKSMAISPATMLQSEEAVLERLRKQQLVETVEQMSPIYLEGIKRILTVSADTELISGPAYYHAALHAPSLNAFGSAISIIQDELGHAHIAFRLLRDLGVDTDWLIFEREPKQFKYPYAFDVPLTSWPELLVANAFYDRAGYTLLGDIYQSTTFGPWKRALVKVDKEETFHLRHGEQGMRKLNQTTEGHETLQQAVDWMFLLTVEWFGLPDKMKKHTEQLDYGFKGKSNDELRQHWMSTAVPLCEELHLTIPAHYDAEQQKYLVDGAFPQHFDAQARHWEGACTWEDVMKRWKARGPANEQFVRMLQRGKREMLRLLEQEA
jgi:ring-1,2-phenylacetyl-CoA epoxidase subunit PaaA